MFNFFFMNSTITTLSQRKRLNLYSSGLLLKASSKTPTTFSFSLLGRPGRGLSSILVTPSSFTFFIQLITEGRERLNNRDVLFLTSYLASKPLDCAVMFTFFHLKLLGKLKVNGCEIISFVISFFPVLMMCPR